MRMMMLSLVVVLVPVHAAVIGSNTPVVPLTEARIRAEAPKGEQRAWLEYLHRSAEQMSADKAALAAERAGMAEVPGLPKQGFSGRAMRLHAGDAFYKSDEARKTGDIIVSFQTPAGGWSKNLMMDEPRAKGQSYATGNLAPTPEKPGDFDEPKDPKWHYVGTLDNDATNTELRFLAELSAALPGHEGDKYRAAALRGYEYLLKAQYPNGGWPQVWPLEGGYHDAITFNDNAVIESAETLAKVADGVRVVTQPEDADDGARRVPGQGVDPHPTHPGDKAAGMNGAPMTEASTEDYTFVPAELRARAKKAAEKATTLVLRAQVRVRVSSEAASASQPTSQKRDDHPSEQRRSPGTPGVGHPDRMVLTVWAQQYDPLTLQPCSARNYEMPALSSGESADAMEYLMSLPKRASPEGRDVVRAVDAAAAWFEQAKIMGYVFVGGRGTPAGRHLEKKDDAGPLWARYYSLTTGKPIFGDRDKSVHDDVMEISLERRNGYAWYSGGEEKALEEYDAWRRRQ